MSLSSLLNAQVNVSARVVIEASFLFDDETCISNISKNIPFSLANLPDVIVGTNGNNVLQGNSGGPDRTLNVNLGTLNLSVPEIDTFLGVPIGIDCTNTTTDNITFDIGPLPDSANDFLFGLGGSDTLNGAGGDDILIGDSFDPQDGGFGNDNINGGTGSDIVLGGGGNDRINGNDGSDLLFGDYFLGLVEFDLGLPNSLTVQLPDIPLGSGSLDFLGIPFLEIGSGSARIDNILINLGNLNVSFGSGNEGNDTIAGGAGDDIIIADRGEDDVSGGTGNDIILSGAGNDEIDGGADYDIVIYATSPNGVVVNLDEENSYSNEGGETYIPCFDDKLVPTNAEPEFAISPATANDGYGTTDNLQGVEAIVGSAFDDILIGNSADNALEGFSGNDLFIGNAGFDAFDGSDGIDTVSYRQASNGINVTLEYLFTPEFGIAFDGSGGIDVLLSIENVTGSAGDDVITGDGKDNTLFGGAGNDIISGAAGDDIIFGEDGNDTLNGNSDDDFLVGGKGADVLDGGLFGSTIFGFLGEDTASYFNADSGVEVSLASGTGSKGDAEGDQLIGIENLEGSDFEDELTGDDNNNKICGLNGNDEIEGGNGNDVLKGDGGNDELEGGNGNDTLTGGTGNDEIEGGNGDDVLNGDEGNDELEGGNGNDVLNGGTGNDEIEGGNGDDTLTGGIGNDTLTGDDDDSLSIDRSEGGSDLFLLTEGPGLDTITDFEVGIDLLGVASSLIINIQVTSIDDGSSSQIEVSSTNEALAVLEGVSLLDLPSDLTDLIIEV